MCSAGSPSARARYGGSASSGSEYWPWLKAAGRRREAAGRAAERRTIAALSATGEPPVAEPPASQQPAARGVARNTAIFSIGTGISRIVGLGREIVFASYFGTSGEASAYT